MSKEVQPGRIDGQTVAITGATSGIGSFTAAQLADLGARVLVLGRSESRGRSTVSALPNPDRHEFVRLDLADRTSIAQVGDRLGELPRLDALVLNAGVVAGAFGPGPARRISAFGVEEIVGINHLAHAELLRRALPTVRRVVSLGSMLTRKIPFDRENWLSERHYRARVAYAMSKHTVEIFGFELHRRLAETQSIVVHPGGAIDALTPGRPGARVARALFRGIVQGKDQAARPVVAAVASPELRSGEYLGPHRTAHAEVQQPVTTSLDPELGAWLWTETERLLGARIPTEPRHPIG
ncbi:SDR family NAD(P)-dependent oxidoreductase [Amycolatopsis halotolerans]|uniref:SDR family NAD(P)-dependent oxidoreductase n=1 Tax=Amycolatopsis halotolerans TaxID=330083 RepID=A0ABV7QLJ9_9PSEU